VQKDVIPNKPAQNQRRRFTYIPRTPPSRRPHCTLLQTIIPPLGQTPLHFRVGRLPEVLRKLALDEFSLPDDHSAPAPPLYNIYAPPVGAFA